MNYKRGAKRWHVVGLLNGDPLRPRLLCGGDLEWVRGPDCNADDVVRSAVPVCKQCDKSTMWQASDEIVHASYRVTS